MILELGTNISIDKTVPHDSGKPRAGKNLESMTGIKKISANGLFFALLFSAFFVSSCKIIPANDSAIPDTHIPAEARSHMRSEAVFLPEQTDWKQLAYGLELLEWRKSAYAIQAIALKIDLANPALSITAYPAGINENGVFAAKKPWVFAREMRTAVVINATPFKYPSGILSKERALAGIFRAGGTELSAPVARYAALGFMPDNSAFIVSSQTDPIPDSARLVAGGFFFDSGRRRSHSDESNKS
ncbi:MAG: hypothetical protein Pg6C_05060 [Treponemataceae bacterium]|nr:MAG: hypothetical protein Pg6C_05060 [Treponemataceae bacterium]